MRRCTGSRPNDDRRDLRLGSDVTAYQDSFPSPDDLLALPVDEVGTCLLRWFVASREEPQRSTWTNMAWLTGAFEIDGAAAGRLAEVISEAWGWLEAKGLITRQPADRGRDDRYFVTRRGEATAADAEGLATLYAVERATLELHPIMEKEVRPQLTLGQYDVAVFVAMRSVEARVRWLAGLDASLVGTKLMSEAFGAGKRLRFPRDDAGEANGVMDLFRGAMGAFKNPTSHRVFAFDDPAVACQAVLMADLLHRTLDRIHRHLIDTIGDDSGSLPWVDYS